MKLLVGEVRTAMPGGCHLWGSTGRPPSSKVLFFFPLKRSINENWKGLAGRCENFFLCFFFFLFRVMFFILNRFIICRSLYLFL